MSAYGLIKRDYEECMETSGDRLRHCPPKTVLNLDGKRPCEKTYSILPAMDAHGNYGVKMIYIDDRTGEEHERYILNGKEIDYSGITVLRCAMMNRLAMECLGKQNAGKIGFIGNGKINLRTASLLAGRRFVIHGSEKNRGKNLDRFMQYGDTEVDEDFSKLAECDVTVVCTNNTDPDKQIDEKDIGEDIIVLDCGYTLSEYYRDSYVCFSDHPEQLSEHYYEEFPTDGYMHDFLPMQAASGRAGQPRNRQKKRAVYLFGVGIADLSMAKALEGIWT